MEKAKKDKLRWRCGVELVSNNAIYGRVWKEDNAHWLARIGNLFCGSFASQSAAKAAVERAARRKK